jgi:hypothetical protein
MPNAVEEQGAATQQIARNTEQTSKGSEQVSWNIAGVNCAAKRTVDHSGASPQRRQVRIGSMASIARRGQVGCFTSSSGHQISRTDLLTMTAAIRYLRHAGWSRKSDRQRRNERAAPLHRAATQTGVPDGIRTRFDPTLRRPSAWISFGA